MSAIKREVIIGDCRLLLGDCLEVMKELEAVDHVLCDPPYEESLHQAKNNLRGRLRKDGGAELKGLDFSSIDEIRDDVVASCQSILQGWFIAFCTVEGTAPWANSINASALKYKRSCVWVKPDCTPQLNGQGPAQGFECFVTAWGGCGKATWNAGGKRGVYTHTVNPPDRHGAHPTEKPWRLFAELLKDFTNEGQTILDPFSGSGTTGVACVKSGRKFIGIEKDETYFNVMCERIQKSYDQPDFFVSAPSKQKETQDSFEM